MAEEPGMVQFYLMGKPHRVPRGLTIQKAMEYAGFRLLRGCGCRGGFCGACGTVYRTPGDYRLKVGLACQTVVEDQMFLALIPFYPAVKSTYRVEDLSPTSDTLISLYPEILRCVGCNSCRKVCPQEIEVMRYIAAAQRGDIAKVADLSFDCLMCGLCASRCPAEIVQYNVAILARRLYACHVARPAAHLAARVEEIGRGACEADLDLMTAASEAELRRLYAAREIEPDE
ncbi:MAG: 4Fe-4S dicluster domain-containing protein [candidate division NC10 bacterium]